MLSVVVSLVLLAAMGGIGVVVLRRAKLGLEPLEEVAYGVPLGAVVASLVLLALAGPLGFGALLVVTVGAWCAVGIAALSPRRRSSRAGVGIAAKHVAWVGVGGRPDVRAVGRIAWSAVRRVGWLPALVLGAFILRWALFWWGALRYEEDGIWAGQINIWSDWAQHVSDVTSFAYGDNFPPEHPRYADTAYAYHHLPSLTAAALVTLGMDPAYALTLHSFVFSICILLSLFAFARRLTADGGAAALTLVLFLLGGGLGWVLVATEMNGAGVWVTLRERPFDLGRQLEENFRWQNVFFSAIAPQRGYLYGMPLTLLTFTLLAVAVRRGRRRLFVAAGIAAGLLPFAHLGPLPTLALITPFLFLLFPSRNWLFFFGVWIALTVPQLYWQQGGEVGGGVSGAGTRWLVGWLADPDPWPWFWLKNLGWFVPLLGLALIDRETGPEPGRRFLWAFMPTFAIANLVVLQPDPWDNAKLLVYWFLAVCVLVAALLVKTWRAYREPVVRTLIVGVIATMTLSGALLNLQQVLGTDRYRWLSTEEIELAEAVRAATPPHALFAVGLQVTHPVPMLSGRRVLMSYPGWIWPRGIDPAPRERDLRAIYAFGSDAPRLLAGYGVDYVVIGPIERSELGANEEAFRARYPIAVSTENYAVYDVRNPDTS